MIRHAGLSSRFAPAQPILALPVSMIQPSFRALLVATIGAAPLLETSLLAAGQATVTLAVIAVPAQEKHSTAFATQANPQPQNHVLVNRHRLRRRLDKATISWQLSLELAWMRCPDPKGSPSGTPPLPTTGFPYSSRLRVKIHLWLAS